MMELTALIRWAESVSVGQHWVLSELLLQYPQWISHTYVQNIPSVQLPISAGGYACGWWHLCAVGSKLSEGETSRHMQLRTLGHRVANYAHWREAADDILRYLNNSRYIVVQRERF